MANINGQDLVDEIRFNIKEKDFLKARLVLSSLGEVDRKTQKQALFEISRAEDDFSIPLITRVIANSPDISKSFPHLKEVLFSKVLDSPQVLLDLFSNGGDSLNRAFLAKISGEIRLQKAVPILLKILTEEKDFEVIETVIIALGMIGDETSVSAVSEFMYSGSRQLVIAAVQTLGDLATPEAIQKLADRLGGDTDIDLMVLDIFARSQLPEALKKLNETLESENAHLRNAGKQRLGAIGVTAIRILINNLLKDNPDLVIHSMNLLGDIGDTAAIPAIRKLLHNEPKDPNVRFAAYEAMGRLPNVKGAFALAAGLEDPDDSVRAAAAKAIEKNYNSVLAAGIKNMTRSEDSEAHRIILTIIDSLCDNIFLDLLDEDSLKVFLVKHLKYKAHPDIRSHFARLLRREGHDDLAKQISSEKVHKDRAKLKVFAVDDSRMILNIYRTVLHNLECEPHLFEFPATALEHVKKERPDLILTDLNMPEITGIDFTIEVRKWHTKEELPVIMVTTQDEERDNKAAYAAGINSILQKPFTQEQIGKVLAEFKGKRVAKNGE